MPPCGGISAQGRAHGRGSSLPAPLPVTSISPFIGNPYPGANPTSAISSGSHSTSYPTITLPPSSVPNNEVANSYSQSFPVLPAVPSEENDASISVDEQLHAATAMIEVSGSQTDVLERSQQRRGASNLPSQQRLRTFAQPYPPVSLAASSTSASLYSTSQLSFKAGFDAGIMHGSRSQRDNKRDQVTNGWRHVSMHHPHTDAHELWKDKVAESLNLACVTLGHDQLPADSCLEKKIVRGLSSFQSKLAAFAESFANDYLQDLYLPISDQPLDDLQIRLEERVVQITDASVPSHFFLHKQNEEGGVERLFRHPTLEQFHIECWYKRDVSPVNTFRSSYQTTLVCMLAFSAVALLCGLHRVSQGRCSNQRNTLKFSTENYAEHFDNYRNGILNGLQHESFGELLCNRLAWLNQRGFEELGRKHGPASPQKIRPVVIPPAATQWLVFISS
ncbi:hypothetical protein HD554DRAFT_2172293 [Boletus coccyginus]|nr:hypothetical protein HD554DRAFT_2172293 [Boletus coccyginus]